MSVALKLIQHPNRQKVTERYLDFSSAKPGTSAYRTRLLVDFWHEARDTGERLRQFDMAVFTRFVEVRGEDSAHFRGRMNVAHFETANVMSLRYDLFGDRHQLNVMRNLHGAQLGDLGAGAILDAVARRFTLVRQLGVPLLIGGTVEALDPVPLTVHANLAVIPLAANGRGITGVVTCSQLADEPERPAG